jgi:hypothetical protein
MKPFKFLTKNIRTSEYLNGEIMDIGPMFHHPTTSELIRGITYRDEDGNRKYCIIDETHPLWDEIPVNQ